MIKLAIYSFLLLAGLLFSQLFHLQPYESTLNSLTMICLAYVMIEIGLEFNIARDKLKEYGKDYLIAITAAVLPWIFCIAYFLYFFHIEIKEAILLSHFAAPTSAGVLFTMLSAIGLAGTWVYKKARLLAIFDDFDTILLMIPMQMMFIGFRWEIGLIVVLTIAMVWLAYRFLNTVTMPTTVLALIFYSVVIWGGALLFELGTGLHFEILIPSFCFGCLLIDNRHQGLSQAEIHRRIFGFDHGMKAAFMFLVGLSLPRIEGDVDWNLTFTHAIGITILSNLGKCYPLFCYRREATLRERFALCVSLFPRGELGGGILAISAITYQVHDFAAVVSAVSLFLNLVLTGAFIIAVRLLIPLKGRRISLKQERFY
jgi:Kef-type K+ transport system membrane component KefB